MQSHGIREVYHFAILQLHIDSKSDVVSSVYLLFIKQAWMVTIDFTDKCFQPNLFKERFKVDKQDTSTYLLIWMNSMKLQMLHVFDLLEALLEVLFFLLYCAIFICYYIALTVPSVI